MHEAAFVIRNVVNKILIRDFPGGNSEIRVGGHFMNFMKLILSWYWVDIVNILGALPRLPRPVAHRSADDRSWEHQTHDSQPTRPSGSGALHKKHASDSSIPFRDSVPLRRQLLCLLRCLLFSVIFCCSYVVVSLMFSRPERPPHSPFFHEALLCDEIRSCWYRTLFIRIESPLVHCHSKNRSRAMWCKRCIACKCDRHVSSSFQTAETVS